MVGRPIGSDYHQGDVEEGIALWVGENGCTEEVVGLTCRVWESCEGGHSVRLCLHGGGHVVPQGWLDLAIGWAKDGAGEQRSEK